MSCLNKLWCRKILFQTLISTKKATYHDLEAGAKSKSNENEISIGKKCSRLLVKTTLTCFILAVFIAYFMAISRHSNLIGNLQEFDVAMVTKSPLIGKLQCCPYAYSSEVWTELLAPWAKTNFLPTKFSQSKLRQALITWSKP